MHTGEYQGWYESHKESCSANNSGSSGKMEIDAVIDMFKRSVEKFETVYKNYIGDGDSKTFTGLHGKKSMGTAVIAFCYSK